MKNIFNIHCFFCLSCLCITAFAANPPISATIDQDHIASGATVRLLVQRDGTSNGHLDIGPLKADFDILSSNSGTSVQINNGDMTSKTQVELVLSPKHDGKLQIPSLEWNGEHTQPLGLTVGGAGNSSGQQAGPNDAQHVTLTATADQSEPYVQAAVVLTVKLSTDQAMQQASLELAPNDAVLISQLGTDRQSTETHNGHTYQVFERKYLLFPQHSGRVSIEGPVLAAQVPDMSSTNSIVSDPFFANALQNSALAGMMQSMRPMRALHLRAKPIVLDVLPRPAGQTGANWLPALSMKLSERWNAGTGGNAEIHVGEPLTRHVTLEAVGLTGAQLPDLGTLISAPDGIKIYPDQGTIADHPKGDSLIGSREQDIALIASQPGHYVMPPVRLGWWDTINNVQREATLPAHEFDVLPAVGVAPITPGQASAPPSVTVGNPAPVAVASANLPSNLFNQPVWLWIVLACGVALIAVLAFWWAMRRRKVDVQHMNVEQARPSTGNAASKFKEFHRDCIENNPHAARRHLMEWSLLHWPLDPPVGLNALAQRLNDPEVALLLRELDRCCYTDSRWQGENLARTLRIQPRTDLQASPTKELSELYP